MERRIDVGVDAGGSATVAALAADGAYIRLARGAAGNPTTIGTNDAADAILMTIRDVLRHERPTAIYVGAAGAGRAHVARELESLIASGYPRARVCVGDDAAIALRAAIAEGPGVVVIAGTGSTAYAENGERSVRVGGWGALLGDEGSAFAIGFAALRYSARVLDGRARAEETSALVERTFSIRSRDDLIGVVYDAPLDRARIASLAPAIVAFAGKGTHVAREIVDRAADDLVELALAAIARADVTDAPRIALSGGLFREPTYLSERVVAMLAERAAKATTTLLHDEPALGAMRRAARL